MSAPEYHFDVEQATLKWLRLHLGRPTASSFSSILTTDMELRKGEGVKTYIYEKCAEVWRNEPLPQFASFQTDQGLLREEKAKPAFEMENNCKIIPCGFVESADRRCGCSPDGLIGEDGGIEIKCPEAQTHVKYLIENKLPNDYVQQVQGSLYVTGRKWWKFYSWRAKFPPFVLTVERDEELMEKIDASMQKFYAQLDEAMATLKAYAPK